MCSLFAKPKLKLQILHHISEQHSETSEVTFPLSGSMAKEVPVTATLQTLRVQDVGSNRNNLRLNSAITLNQNGKLCLAGAQMFLRAARLSRFVNIPPKPRQQNDKRKWH